MSCDIWTGNVDKHGYGKTSRSGVCWTTHRLAYAERHSLTKDEMRDVLLMHTCDNRRCRNPDHLVVGTQAANMADMVAKGRSCRGPDVNGSKLSESQVLAIRSEHVAGCPSAGGRALAKKYNVTKRTIQMIVERRTWYWL